MPQIETNGALIHFQVRGDGPETIVFAHGLLWSERIFDDQVAALRSRYQGQTVATRSGYDMETLYADTVGLIETLGAVPCHFVGVSMGGIVGLRIAVRKPELVMSLVLFATSADAETEENKKRYRLLTLIARLFGLRVVADKVMAVMWGKTFLNDPLRVAPKRRWRQRFIANHRLGVARAVTGVIERKPIYHQIDTITAPTLVAIGDEDAAISIDRARRIHERIARSEFAVIQYAGHTPTVEEPAVSTKLLEEFLSRKK
jgi:3-oxoadipate enol-lactonase